MSLTRQRAPLFVLLALALTAMPSGARAAECVVKGRDVTLENVTVRPERSAAFQLTVHGVPATAKVPAKATLPTQLQFGGAISFKATAKRPWYTVAVATDLLDGMIQLRPGAHVVNARMDGASVTGALVMAEGDVTPGEEQEPDETLRPVTVPCDRLTLDWIADESSEEEPIEERAVWQSRAGERRLELRREPRRSAAPLVLESAGCEGEGCFFAASLEERPGWLRVVIEGGEHARVTAWVRRADLVKLPEDVGVGRGVGCLGRHGPGLHGHSYSGSPPEGLVEGPARVIANTTIFAEPGSGPWAVVETETTFQVRYARGDTWAELTEIPGVSGPGLSAFIPLSAVVGAPTPVPNSTP